MDALTTTPATTLRISVRFAADGATAACLAGPPGPPLAVEVWRFGRAVDRSRLLPGSETALTQALPLPTGAALVIRHRESGHDLVRLDGAGERRLATLTSPGFRLLPGPRRPLAVSWSRQRSTLWTVHGDRLERLAEVAGELVGGCPLGSGELGFTLDDAAVALDPVTGAVRRLAGAGSFLLLSGPVGGPTGPGGRAAGLAVLAVPTGAGLRLAYHRDGTITVPERLNGLDGSVLPLALSPDGSRLALRVDRGARSHLYLHRVDDDTLEEVDVPLGVIGASAGWSATGLRFPYSSPTVPIGIARAVPWRVSGAGPAPAGPVRLERFGGVEAVVYGAWRTSPLVVVAVHGGPDSAWRAEHDPLLEQLTAAGTAVVAPNPRGSTGYGRAHAEALHGAWGGPDREDLAGIGLALRQGRPAGAPRPALYGESYGAYLALLAAAHQPELWSRCAAVAPFICGARLYADAGPAVRAHLDRLGGRTPLPDGGHDLAVLADRIAVPVLILHGSADEVVPVGQSRQLHARLRTAGRDVRYVEVPGAGHDPGLNEAVIGFLSTGDRPQQERR